MTCLFGTLWLIYPSEGDLLPKQVPTPAIIGIIRKAVQMTKTSPKIFQFKIKLCGITPMIWRRVHALSDSTFGDLHYVIQGAMGWDCSHLHEFAMCNPRTGSLDRIASSEEVAEVGGDLINQDSVTIDSYFSSANKKANYTYDFGDDWEHEIVLEKILDVVDGVDYPICIAGKRACPPEDCGGVWGYQNLIEILADPNNEEYEERLEWYGEFDSEEFDLKEVRLNSRT